MRISRLVSATTILLGSTAAYASVDDQNAPEEQLSGTPTERAVRDDAFGILTMPARVGSTAAVAWGAGGYDSASQGPRFDVVAEVRLWGPIALRGGAGYSNHTDRMRPNVGARAQLLRQEAHGVDGALSVLFKAEGFTEPEGEIETVVSVGRTFGAWSAILNLAYGQDPEGNERDGEARLSVGHHWDRLVLGLDARARTAIGTQRGAAAVNEPKFDFMAGPVVTARVGPVAVFAEVGPSVLKLPQSATRYGVTGLVGLGSAF